MIKHIIRLITLFSCVQLAAQVKDTTYWNKSFSVGLNVNQAAFNDSWKTGQGGNNNAALAGFLFAKSEYVVDHSSMVNDLQMQYGSSYSESNLDPRWRKNMDRIFFDNKYNYALSKPWSVFASLLFQTQFTKGYKYETALNAANAGRKDSMVTVSNLLAPGYLDEAAGLEWKPLDYITARFGPIAFRQIFQIDETVFRNNKGYDAFVKDTTAYGVKKGYKIRNLFGLSVVVKLDKDLTPNLNLKLIYQYFSAYDNLKVSTNRLDAILTAKITKIINVNLQGVLYYNQDQIRYLQMNESLALGIVYKLTNVPPAP